MSKPRITALDIEKKEFTSSLKGYNAAEVRAFLERVASEVQNLETEVRSLRERLAGAESDRDRMKEIEDRVKDALIVAQSAADDARANARKEAELIIREAESQRVQVVCETERLRAERDAFVAQLRAFIDAFYQKLEPPTEAAVHIEERRTIGG